MPLSLLDVKTSYSFRWQKWERDREKILSPKVERCPKMCCLFGVARGAKLLIRSAVHFCSSCKKLREGLGIGVRVIV
jgi:hypothetical protein